MATVHCAVNLECSRVALSEGVLQEALLAIIQNQRKELAVAALGSDAVLSVLLNSDTSKSGLFWP